MGEIIGKKTDGYIESIILTGAGKGNILPLTSACNVRCIFCSHHQNPPDLETYRITPRSLEEVERILSFMDPGRPVVIGESTTRIIEGEPFTHPAITKILRLVRATFPRSTIRITTNGSLLDERMVDFLSRQGNVVVTLSLNSAGELGRALLMGDVNAGCAVKSAFLLKKYGVPFQGSVVAMPHLVGWNDPEEAVKYLCTCGAETVRVFLPGFTDRATPALRFDPSLWEELNQFVSRLRGEVKVPLTCEPPAIGNLKAEVGGVIDASPAAGAGIGSGDVILAVNGLPVHTRVHAFKQVLKAGAPEVTVKRGNETLILQVKKEPGERSGLVMDYDLDPTLIADMARAARRRRASKVLVLTSELAGPVVNMGLQQFWREGAEVEAIVVKNRFFGGSIKAAGLLTVTDFRAAVEEALGGKLDKKPRLVLLPGLAFDHRGRDLTGRSYLELGERFGINFEVM